ncbi:uncharacterized protein PG998_003901 [Apiospora kogelbergensis]|uniref:Uncharacterized protein n=1 Tax=Apiospora kogelbergensis TaxID=1337665 RepID=A0AAW0QJG0_9PEZI
MDDAVAGKVSTHGGGQAYTGATKSAHLLTLGEPGKPVAAEKVAPRLMPSIPTRDAFISKHRTVMVSPIRSLAPIP